MFVYPLRNRFKGSGMSAEAVSKELYKELNTDISINLFELDHIMPYCISLDNSKENLQLLEHAKHRQKCVIDAKIIREMKEKGWIERIRAGCLELKKSLDFLKKCYLERFSVLFSDTT